MATKLTHDQYVSMREFFRKKGEVALEKQDFNEADYCAGVVRGLDLAFQDGSAKSIYER
jgi:hypothetical protein